MKRFLAVFLVFCGLGITAEAAKLQRSTDRVTASEPLTLEQHGQIKLVGIHQFQKHGMPLGPVEVKKVGQDRYGIALVQLYLPGEAHSVQEALIREGSAVLYDRAASPDAWKQAESEARTAKRGVWVSTIYQIGANEAADALGQFRLVAGRVTRSYKGRDMWWFNFGDDWKTDFSVRIPKRAWRSFGKDFMIADGACVRVRGTVFWDNGPAIELTRPEQLEMLDANACRG